MDLPNLLGPFIGHTTETSTSIWLFSRAETKLFVALYDRADKLVGKPLPLEFSAKRMWCAIVRFSGLQAGTEYTYKISKNESMDQVFDLDGLDVASLKFSTMPAVFDTETYRYDFLLLSCNNPDAVAKASEGKKHGYELWRNLPQILEENKSAKDRRVLFAIMGGDQVYADAWRKKLEHAKDEAERVNIYLEVYAHYWSNPHYRKLLASLPAYLMWDDHDIMDGWGSELSFFKKDSNGVHTPEFKPEWNNMFLTARRAFRYFQASRNPDAVVADDDYSFDTCFKIGPLGFVLADLRSHRNWIERRFWTKKQELAVQAWIEKYRSDIEVLFFVSPVVFAHGSPEIEEGLLRYWDLVPAFIDRAKETHEKITSKGLPLVRWGLIAIIAVVIASVVGVFLFADWYVTVPLFLVLVGLGYALYRYVSSFKRADIENLVQRLREDPKYSLLGLVSKFISIMISTEMIEKLDLEYGDLSDDIRDAWGGPGNEAIVDSLLDYLFELQNDPNPDTRVHVAILSGDIHTGGYSNIYSNNEAHHERPVIPHIVSSPVGYTPFPWFLEALYRKFTIGAVKLGARGSYSAQISHHFTERNVVICSVRKESEDKKLLKVKFYVEGFSEPQTAVFDFDKVSHVEAIDW